MEAAFVFKLFYLWGLFVEVVHIVEGFVLCLCMPVNEVVLVILCGGRVFIVLCVCVGFVGGSIVRKGLCIC